MGKNSSSLPPISTLFKDSWDRFKGSVLNIFLITLIGWGFGALVIIAGLIISIPLGIYPAMQLFKGRGFDLGAISSIGGIGIVLLIMLVCGAVLVFTVQASTIIAVANYKKRENAWEIFKSGLKFVWPISLLSLLTGFIALGGYFLLLIPGIVLVFLMSFSFYELVLTKKSITESVKRSIRIVSSNFWGILGRTLLWVIITIAVVNIPNILALQNRSGGLFSLQFILQMLVSWYGIAYMVTLYQQAEKVSNPGSSSLRWPLVISIVGWVLGIIFVVTLINFVTGTLIPSIEKQKKNRMMDKQMENSAREIMKLIPSGTIDQGELQTYPTP